MRWLDKIKVFFKQQGMPKYQNMYLGANGFGRGGSMHIKNSGKLNGAVEVKNCYYDTELASYVYWVCANGIMVPVPEKNLEVIQHTESGFGNFN